MQRHLKAAWRGLQTNTLTQLKRLDQSRRVESRSKQSAFRVPDRATIQCDGLFT